MAPTSHPNAAHRGIVHRGTAHRGTPRLARLPSGRPRAARMLALLVLTVLWLPACGGKPRPTGELLEIQDDRHRIANPARIGASATGRACGIDRNEALTSAQRVAQFNLRSLTGQARYNVRFDLVDETRTEKGVCVEVSALALEPVPYLR